MKDSRPPRTRSGPLPSLCPAPLPLPPPHHFTSVRLAVLKALNDICESPSAEASQEVGSAGRILRLVFQNILVERDRKHSCHVCLTCGLPLSAGLAEDPAVSGRTSSSPIPPRLMQLALYAPSGRAPVPHPHERELSL